eukprot:867378_1
MGQPLSVLTSLLVFSALTNAGCIDDPEFEILVFGGYGDVELARPDCSRMDEKSCGEDGHCLWIDGEAELVAFAIDQPHLVITKGSVKLTIHAASADHTCTTPPCQFMLCPTATAPKKSKFGISKKSKGSPPCETFGYFGSYKARHVNLWGKVEGV